MTEQQRFELFETAQKDQPDIPLVYLAMPLSHLDEREREHVELLAHTVTRALDDATQKSSTDPWRVSTHSPAKRSAPWKNDGLAADDVYRLNSQTLWEEADAIIVIGYGGEVSGAARNSPGQEACISRSSTSTVPEHQSAVNSRARQTSTTSRSPPTDPPTSCLTSSNAGSARDGT
jgi:hypothetical protein